MRGKGHWVVTLGGDHTMSRFVDDLLRKDRKDGGKPVPTVAEVKARKEQKVRETTVASAREHEHEAEQKKVEAMQRKHRVDDERLLSKLLDNPDPDDPSFNMEGYVD